MDDVIFDRYVGEVAYTESVTVGGQGPSMTEEGALRAGGDVTATVGIAAVRSFQASATDVAVRTRGDDVRLMLKEFPAPPDSDDEADLAETEVRVVAALEGDRFPRLYGQLQMEMDGGVEGDREWFAALGVAPPRKNSRWLVYAYDGDGGNTLLNFARPTSVRVAAAQELRGARRSLGLSPLPQNVPWATTARFVVKGVLPQTLDALGRMHDQGYAHRCLTPGSITLSAKQGMNKNVAIEDCDPTNLCVKLGDFGRAVLLDDASAQGPGPLGLVAEDLRAAGLAFLQVLLGSLAETQTLNPDTGLSVPAPRPPSVTTGDLARQIALFDDRIAGEGGFAEFCKGEPAWNKVVALLEADDGAGWNFLELLLSAPVSLSSAGAGGEVPGLRTARGMASHPFLQTQAIALASRGVVAGSGSDNSPRQKLFGLFEW